MKKIALLAALLVAAVAPSVNAQEVTYVEDPAQGYLENKFNANWFIQAEAGANVFMSPDDTKVKNFGNRIGGSFQLTVGKWFSPVFGVRFGVDAFMAKGAADPANNCDHGLMALRPDLDYAKPGYIAQKATYFGPVFDGMLNLTNWWCGYKPGRVYNAVFYLGAGVQFPVAKKVEGSQDPGKHDGKYGFLRSKSINIRAGLLNKFAVSKRVDILLDLRFDYMTDRFDDVVYTRIPNGNVLLGVEYKFGKTDWNGPITAVCPTWKYTDAEGDALASRLQAAEAKIADLEKQLRDCLNRKPEVIEKGADAPLATIYYPIGKSRIIGTNQKIVNAVANVMKDTDKNYVLTGWADNYTGTDKINAKLRKDRVNGVKNALVKKGVAASRIDAQINDGNLTNFGAKCASLDRAVTVNEAK